jgi:hypothetical protein
MALLALAGGAFAVLADSLPALLVAMFVLGIANRLSQVSSTLAGTQGPVAARSEGTASALLTATRQCGSALGVAILSATLVAVHGTAGHRTISACLRPRPPWAEARSGIRTARGQLPRRWR